MIWLWIVLGLLLYVAIASGCIFALLMAAEKYMGEGYYEEATFVLCGVFWPLAALPAAAYIAAMWLRDGC